LAEQAAANEQLPILLYEIVRHRGHWRMLHIGKHSSSFTDQASATAAALNSAKQAREAGREVAVRVLRTDGKVFTLDPDSGSELT
jgi:hypothetical protein